jgi:acyl dehydratase
MSESTASIQRVYFESVDVGSLVPAVEYGPHSLVTAVFWAGFQENRSGLHFDREYVRKSGGAASIVASGALRQSFLTRTITDWAGPRSFLRAMSVRHTASTFEGDMQIYSASVVEKSQETTDPWIVCELDGRNQNGEQILKGRCTLLLPLQSVPSDRPVWESI